MWCANNIFLGVFDTCFKIKYGDREINIWKQIHVMVFVYQIGLRLVKGFVAELAHLHAQSAWGSSGEGFELRS